MMGGVGTASLLRVVCLAAPCPREKALFLFTWLEVQKRRLGGQYACPALARRGRKLGVCS